MSLLPVVVLGVAVTVSAADIRLAYGQQADAQARPRSLSRAEQTDFLARAEIIRERRVSKGITGTVRATLSDGVFTHDASIQTVDEQKAVFEGTRGTEIDFRDSWRYNLAAYHLDILLDLGMVPVTVHRRYKGRDASFTWWVDDVMMDEGERYKKKIVAPDQESWNRQLWTLRIFDQLIDNTDRNLGNMLIDRDWKVWMIDHTRAFRRQDELRTKANLRRCDRQLLARLKALDTGQIRQTMGQWLRDWEIAPMLARRDLIVQHFESAGPSALYDSSPRQP
jgi:hypothetical protein